MRNGLLNRCRSIAGALALLGFIAAGQNCRAAEDNTIDIAIDLPRAGTGMCTFASHTSGKAKLQDSLGGHVNPMNPNNYIPPDFSNPPTLSDTDALTASVSALSVDALDRSQTAERWLRSLAGAKLALATSEEISDKIYATPSSPPALCTLVVEVHLTSALSKEDGSTASAYTDPGHCLGKGPIFPTHPTICLAWPALEAETDLLSLLKQRQTLYNEAHLVLSRAFDEFSQVASRPGQ